MIVLPFKIPSAPDWKIDWDGIRTSPFWSFRLVGHGEDDNLAYAKLACEALVADPSFRKCDSESRAELLVATLLHDVGKIIAMRPDDDVHMPSLDFSIACARRARKFFWQTLDMAGSEEKMCFRETVCALIHFFSVPLCFLANPNPERLLGSVAAEGCIIKGFTLAKLATFVRANILGDNTDGTGNILDKLSLFLSIARDMECLDTPPHFADSFSRFAWFEGRINSPDQRIHDDTWGKVYMMCGLPGTGKDTWIQNNLPDIPMVSLDRIRAEYGISWDDDQSIVHALAFNRAQELLGRKQPFVWNATSLTPDFRRKELQLFRDYGAYTEIVAIETSWNEELRRNRERKKVVPEGVIDTMLGRLIPPSVKEAHDVLRLYC